MDDYRCRTQPIEIEAVGVREVINLARTDFYSLPAWVILLHETSCLKILDHGIDIFVRYGWISGSETDVLAQLPGDEIILMKEKPFRELFEA